MNGSVMNCLRVAAAISPQLRLVFTSVAAFYVKKDQLWINYATYTYLTLSAITDLLDAIMNEHLNKTWQRLFSFQNETLR